MPESIPPPGAATAAAVLPLLRLAMEENHGLLSGESRSRDAETVWLVAEDLLALNLTEDALDAARLGAVLGLHYALFREFRDALTPEFREKFRRRVRLAVESMSRAFPGMRSPVQGPLPEPVPGVVESIILTEISRHVQRHASVRGLAEITHWSTLLLLEALRRPGPPAEEIGPRSWAQALTAKPAPAELPATATQPLIISGEQLMQELKALAAHEQEVRAPAESSPGSAAPAGTPHDEWLIEDHSEDLSDRPRKSSRASAGEDTAKRTAPPSLRTWMGHSHPEFVAEVPERQERESFQTGPVAIDLPDEARSVELPRRRRRKTSRKGRLKIVFMFLALFALTFFLLNKAYKDLPGLRQFVNELFK